VRIVKRKVVVTDPGHGLDVVRRMEHESVIADPFDTRVRPDVVLFFLQSVRSAKDAHRKHGYQGLWMDKDNLLLMYRQVPGKNAFRARKLTPRQIEKIAQRI